MTVKKRLASARDGDDNSGCRRQHHQNRHYRGKYDRLMSSLPNSRGCGHHRMTVQDGQALPWSGFA
ncbi:MAG: hypothetical protein HKP12_13170 [Gammaproteobacteria bacterium]|nr:hypothetical protein [Gammaproteobacteria bacterium]NNJ98098.1 hypothetical protein [Gammaproteobacteria bacterium]